MLEKARHIVVEGPIGAGKTSFAKRLAERLPGAKAVCEAPERNTFLPRFYLDMERWALPTQLSFLFQRLEKLDEIAHQMTHSRVVVSDFLIEKDLLFAALNLPQDEFDLYEQTYQRIVPAQLLQPDLVVYLQAQPGTLIERIRRRGVEAERRITEQYLERVNARYASFFHQYEGAPLFIVDAEVLNPIDLDDDFDLILERLKAMRGYREFFGYAA